MYRLVFAWLVTLAGSSLLSAQTAKLTGGDHNRAQVVYSIPLEKPSNTPFNVVIMSDGSIVPAQVVPPALHATDEQKQLVFVLPRVKAKSAMTLKMDRVARGDGEPSFRFEKRPGESLDLFFNGRAVLRSMNGPRTEENHYFSFKPFHHVYDPAEGKVLLTAGAHPNTKEFLFPHHRGLFYGWNRISYERDGKPMQADIWHGTKNVFSQYESTLAQEAGPVLGRERAAITWRGPDGVPFAEETREITAYSTTGGTLIDFASILKTDLPKVRLDGDPQHAGFHFRANQEVALKNKGQTYYLRPDGKDEPGKTRNWEPKGKDPRTINLPWNAVSFVVQGERYTVLRINHPSNPGESRGSERDYGRFGNYFEYDVTPEKPLKVQYRVWVQRGEMTVEQCEEIARGFTTPLELK